MTTPRDLIKSSLQLIGALGVGEDVDGDEITDLFDRLNRMISAWSTQKALIFADTLVTKVLTASDGEYTIGSGGDINTSKPIAIKNAYVRNGTQDTDLSIIDEDVYASIGDKSLAADPPEKLYYKTGHPLGTIILWPAPASGLTLYMNVYAPLTQFTSLSQDISLPEGYEETIEYNFAKRIAGMYGKSLTMEQDELAKEGLTNIKQANRNADDMVASLDTPSGGGNSGSFDIYTRRYI